MLPATNDVGVITLTDIPSPKDTGLSGPLAASFSATTISMQFKPERYKCVSAEVPRAQSALSTCSGANADRSSTRTQLVKSFGEPRSTDIIT